MPWCNSLIRWISNGTQRRTGTSCLSYPTIPPPQQALQNQHYTSTYIVDTNHIPNPTGVVASSFEPEVLAAQKAFAHILSLQVKQGQCLRWFTDSKSCVDNLQGNWMRYGEAMMVLWNTIQEVLKSKVSIEVVWVPSHCGLQENERADYLANAVANRSSLVQQQGIPVTADSFKQIMLKRTQPKTIKSLSDVPQHLRIQPRQAEVLLNRLMTECCNRVRAFHDGITVDHTCVKCSLNIRETVEHCILRCPGRATTRRHIFGRLERGTTVENLCRKQPTAILEFMNNEGILHEAPTM